MGRRRPPPPRLGALLVALAVALVGCGTGGTSPSSLDAAAMDSSATDQVVAADEGSTGGEAVDPELDQDEAAVVRPVVEIPTAWPSDIEAVYGRYWLYWEAFAAAHGPPEADPTYGPLRELSSEANWASLQDQLRRFAADGLVLVLPENSRTEHMLRMPNASVLSGNEGDEVVLQDCWIDDFRRQSVEGDIVGEAAEAKLMNVVMKVIDGEWRVHGVSRATPESDGFQQCAELIDER